MQLQYDIFVKKMINRQYFQEIERCDDIYRRGTLESEITRAVEFFWDTFDSLANHEGLAVEECRHKGLRRALLYLESNCTEDEFNSLWLQFIEDIRIGWRSYISNDPIVWTMDEFLIISMREM